MSLSSLELEATFVFSRTERAPKARPTCSVGLLVGDQQGPGDGGHAQIKTFLAWLVSKGKFKLNSAQIYV